MTDDQKRRIFQKVKSMTLTQYWDWLERVNTQAYLIGQDHMTEKIRQIILDGRKAVLIDWNSNEIKFDNGYL